MCPEHEITESKCVCNATVRSAFTRLCVKYCDELHPHTQTCYNPATQSEFIFLIWCLSERRRDLFHLTESDWMKKVAFIWHLGWETMSRWHQPKSEWWKIPKQESTLLGIMCTWNIENKTLDICCPKHWDVLEVKTPWFSVVQVFTVSWITETRNRRTFMTSWQLFNKICWRCLMFIHEECSNMFNICVYI